MLFLAVLCLLLITVLQCVKRLMEWLTSQIGKDFPNKTSNAYQNILPLDYSFVVNGISYCCHFATGFFFSFAIS